MTLAERLTVVSKPRNDLGVGTFGPPDQKYQWDVVLDSKTVMLGSYVNEAAARAARDRFIRTLNTIVELTVRILLERLGSYLPAEANGMVQDALKGEQVAIALLHDWVDEHPVYRSAHNLSN